VKLSNGHTEGHIGWPVFKVPVSGMVPPIENMAANQGCRKKDAACQNMIRSPFIQGRKFASLNNEQEERSRAQLSGQRPFSPFHQRNYEIPGPICSVCVSTKLL
jgi:hypothetical protein